MPRCDGKGEARRSAASNIYFLHEAGLFLFLKNE